MSTCRDCIHHVVCAVYAPNFNDVLVNGESCSEFKSESDLIKTTNERMTVKEYCCICCREANHPKSFHCNIDNNVYHYCHRHAYIGKRVSDKHVAKKVLTKERIEFWEKVKKEYL